MLKSETLPSDSLTDSLTRVKSRDASASKNGTTYNWPNLEPMHVAFFLARYNSSHKLNTQYKFNIADKNNSIKLNTLRLLGLW